MSSKSTTWNFFWFDSLNIINKSISYEEDFVIEGYLSKVMADIDPEQNALFFSVGWFWIFTLLGLTLPFRIYVSFRCQYQSYSFVKSVSVL